MISFLNVPGKISDIKLLLQMKESLLAVPLSFALQSTEDLKQVSSRKAARLCQLNEHQCWYKYLCFQSVTWSKELRFWFMNEFWGFRCGLRFDKGAMNSPGRRSSRQVLLQANTNAVMPAYIKVYQRSESGDTLTYSVCLALGLALI